MWVLKGVKIVAGLVCAVLLTLFAVRIYDSQTGLPLEPWHTYVPHEARAAALDKTDWRQYLASEAALFEDVRREVTQKLGPDERVPVNRYFEGSPVYPAHFAQDFNRSFVLRPEGPPKGAVVLLHGLTDAPYSMRHVANFYRDRGFVAVVPRLPAHGTVPAALTEVNWEDWLAATRLAVREARQLSGPSVPLHLVGYSNGGALAMMYALDALDDGKLDRPARVVLLSPMIGVTRFARFAGLAGLPAFFPAFAKAAWLDVIPEFNPFKYNSFPVNAARQSHLLTQALQQRIARSARDGKLAELPPVLTFQSVVDFTVSTRAVITALHAHLPANGSELVLFDINRAAKFGPLLRDSADVAMSRILPNGPQRYKITVISNADDKGDEVVARIRDAGSDIETERPLGLSYPPGFYSLSHVALPFPASDGLYGGKPDPADNFGLSLGTLSPRGERNVLIVSLDSLLRATWNPFFGVMTDRIGKGIGATAQASPHR